MGPVELKIVYDKSTYYSGQILKGHLVVKLYTPLPIALIKVRALGHGKVSWTVSKQTSQMDYSSGQYRSTTTYETMSNQEKYLDVKIILFQSVSGQGFGSGEFVFPFSVGLPPNLPGSLNVGIKLAATGYIEYGCKATLMSTKNISLLSSKCKVTEDFMLYGMAPTPLGQVEILYKEDSREIACFGACSFCFTCGKIKATISVNKSNFLPGETVLIKLEVANHSRKTLDSIRFSIMQRIELYARSASRNYEGETDSFLDCKQEPIRPGKKLSVDGIGLTVPNLPSTTEGSSRIVSVEYFAAVVLSEGTDCCPSKVGFRVPITIGHTSLFPGLPQTLPTAPSPNNSSQPIVTSQPTAFIENLYSSVRY